MMNGITIDSFIVLPLLGYGSPNNCSIPRFRDCYVDDGMIAVLTRMGGGNRVCHCIHCINATDKCISCIAEDIEATTDCISRIDEDYDPTYCVFLFNVPDRWKDDFKLILEQRYSETSQDYQDLVLKSITNPALIEKIRSIFKSNIKIR